jgi:hypothetical protein
MKIHTVPSLLAGAALLTACADGRYEPRILDKSFGQSVKHVSRAQIADPLAAANPLPGSPGKMDGYAGVNTMKDYRRSFGQDVDSVQNMTINIGGSSGSSGTQ